MAFFKKEKLNPQSKVRTVIAVMSGKGGVGKTMTTALLASHLTRKGKSVGILDADIIGPSIPKAFGITGKIVGQDGMILPARSAGGIQVMSSNLLLDHPEEPILWRGPLVTDMVRQFFVDVFWKELDYLLIDMPPGTGDVALSIFQQLPIDGILVVTSPQDSVNMIVSKGINMAHMLKIPILGIIENFSYMICSDCGKKLFPFGPSQTKKVAATFGVDLLAEIPVIENIARSIDNGTIESVEVGELAQAVAKILEMKK